jgi:hypothetical protein
LVGAVLVLLVVVTLIWQGVYSIRHPDRPPIGSRMGRLPPPERMKAIGYVLLIAGIVVALLAGSALLAYYVL